MDRGTAASGSTVAKAADSAYKITIALEFDKLNHEGLSSVMVSRYSRLALRKSTA